MKRCNFLMVSTAAVLAVGATTTAFASSHREAPGITETPKVDNTDVYAFRSYEPGRQNYVTIISNFQPGENPGDGPNYYTMDPDAVYEIHIDSNGDAKEDLTYQFKFANQLSSAKGITLNVGGVDQSIALRHVGPISSANDPDLGEREVYTVTQITGDRRSGARGQLTTGGSATFVKPFDNAGNKSIPNYPAYANQFV